MTLVCLFLDSMLLCIYELLGMRRVGSVRFVVLCFGICSRCRCIVCFVIQVLLGCLDVRTLFCVFCGFFGIGF